jgi:hypothetical protein
MPLKITDSVAQGSYYREVDYCRFFKTSFVVLKKSTNEGREARFMVLAIKPRFVPSFETSFHQKVKEATMRASLKSYTVNDLSVINARLVL